MATAFRGEGDLRGAARPAAGRGRCARAVLALGLGLALIGGAEAATAVPLRENAYINDRLFAARVADRIRKTCPTISARLFYAYGEMKKLERYALDQGYGRDEIKAYIKNRAEKQRLYATAEAYLAAHGAVVGDTAGFCALGRAEIEKKSLIGSLLWAH